MGRHILEMTSCDVTIDTIMTHYCYSNRFLQTLTPVQNLGCITSKTYELQQGGGVENAPRVGSRPKSPGFVVLKNLREL